MCGMNGALGAWQSVLLDVSSDSQKCLSGLGGKHYLICSTWVCLPAGWSGQETHKL